MDFELSWFSHISLNSQPSKKQRKPAISFSHKDFHCFELLGFPSDLVSPLYVSQKTQKKHSFENICISENINITTVVSTIRPLKITTKIYTFFHYLLKPNLSQNQQKIKEKPCIPKTSLLSMKQQHLDFPGPTQGPPQSTKTTPRPPQDPPETLRENLFCFGSLPDLCQGPPGTSRGPSKDL